MKTKRMLSGALIASSLILVACGGGEGPIVAPPAAPAAYQEKHMPEGWWTDPKIIAEGKEIFMGKFNIDVNCSSCHGKDGKPVKRGARDFRVPQRMSLYSDSVWFWRVSEGVRNTKMKAWKEKLSEEERWKVIAFEHTFSHKEGDEFKPHLHDDYKPAPTAAEATK